MEREEPVYEVRGDRIASLVDFYREIGQAIKGPGGYVGTSLDAFNDCLAGGFGTPDGGYVIRWLRPTGRAGRRATRKRPASSNAGWTGATRRTAGGCGRNWHGPAGAGADGLGVRQRLLHFGAMCTRGSVQSSAAAPMAISAN
jgi:hypothetical protein